jgi:hypothetical protein
MPAHIDQALAPSRPPARARSDGSSRHPDKVAAEVATALAGMTYEERVRAYRSGAISTHELAIAAGRFPEEMPLLNDEFEWIAINAE